jgi:hypothetical protein
MILLCCLSFIILLASPVPISDNVTVNTYPVRHSTSYYSSMEMRSSFLHRAFYVQNFHQSATIYINTVAQHLLGITFGILWHCLMRSSI